MANKSILITGCSPGSAGESLAKEFHRRGYQVFATARDASKLQSLANIGIHTLSLDVTSKDSIDAAVQHVRRSSIGGKLNILINNAAMFNLMPALDVDIEDGHAMFESNFFGVLRTIQSFMPLILAVEDKDEPRLVVNVSSISATFAPPWQAMYVSSKAALGALSNVLRLELAPLGVKVVTIMSGGIDTAGNKASAKQPRSVPSGSYYLPLAEDIETNKAIEGMTCMPPDVYAKQVADDILRPDPKPVIWRGAMASFAWVLTWFGWNGMMDKGASKGHRLHLVTKGRETL